MKILRLPVFSFVIAKGIKMETKNETKWNQIMKMNIFFQLLISDRLKSFSKEFSFCSFKGRDFCDSSSCCKIIKTKYIIIKYLCKSVILSSCRNGENIQILPRHRWELYFSHLPSHLHLLFR